MNGTQHIPALTSLRFSAALLVVIFHHGRPIFEGAPWWLQNVLSGGFIGVPFFFILSGFILAVNYAPRIRKQKLECRQFWIARVARIYPAYALSLAISFPFFLLSGAGQVSPEMGQGRMAVQGLVTVSLVQAWIPAWAFGWNGPGWSLSVEAFFYLLFPFLMNGWRTQVRWRAVWMLAILAGTLWLLGGAVFGFDVVHHAQQILGWANPLLWLPLFLIGLGIGERHLARVVSNESRCSGTKPVLLAAALAFLMLAVMIANLQGRSQLLFCYALTPLCAGLIYLMADRSVGAWRLLTRKPLVLLGEASFSLYILHRPIHDWFRWMERHWSWLSTETRWGSLLYVITSVGLSVIAFRVVEDPCRAWIRRRFEMRPPQVSERVRAFEHPPVSSA